MTRALRAFSSLLLVPLLAACTHAVPAGCAAQADASLQLVRHRWHTGLIIPREQLVPALGFLKTQLPEARWFEFGWGDREFYRRPDNTWLMLRALLWPTDTVMHVAGLERPAAQLPHGDLISLRLPSSRSRALQSALAASFEAGGQAAPEPLEPGLYGDSYFYAARGTFWFANTCNTWTARRLDDAGIDMRTFMTLTAGSVMEQLREAVREDPCLQIVDGSGT